MKLWVEFSLLFYIPSFIISSIHHSHNLCPWWNASPFIRWCKFSGTAQTQKHAASSRCSRLTVWKQYCPLRSLTEISRFFRETLLIVYYTGRFTVQWRVVALLQLLFWQIKLLQIIRRYQPVVTYGCKVWTLTTRGEQYHRIFERRILRKIFGSVQNEDGSWRIRMNHETEQTNRKCRHSEIYKKQKNSLVRSRDVDGWKENT